MRAEAAPVDALSAASETGLPDRPIRLAVITLPDTAETLNAIDETIELIKKAFAPHPITFERLTSKELERRVRSAEVDAFIASVGFYWRLAPQGLVSVGTLISDKMPDPNHGTALAFVVSSEDDRFRRIEDLKGHELGASFPTAFMSYRIGLAEIARLGEDPEKFFSKVVFTGRTDNDEIATLLTSGAVDAVMLKACWLESKPEHVRAQFKVIGEKKGPVRCRHSTSAYPGIMMSVTQGAPPRVAHIIARTVLSQPHLSNNYRWGLATDLRSVDQVYRDLKIEHYAYLRHTTLQTWLMTYWPWLAIAGVMIVGLIFHSWRTEVLVRERTRELSETLIAKERTQARVEIQRERLENMHKASIVGQLSNMIAHELAQPLGAIQYWCDGQKDLLASETPDPALLRMSAQGIERALKRTRDIVEKVRSYNRGNINRSASVNVDQIVRSAASQLNVSLLAKTHISVIGSSEVCVRGDALEIELMVYNLLKNAIEAANEAPNPQIKVCFTVLDNRVSLAFENSGLRMDDESFMRLQTPLISSKSDGHGLGVSIACALAEVSGGHIEFVRRSAGGLVAVVSLNLAQEQPRSSDEESRTDKPISESL